MSTHGHSQMYYRHRPILRGLWTPTSVHWQLAHSCRGEVGLAHVQGLGEVLLAEQAVLGQTIQRLGALLSPTIVHWQLAHRCRGGAGQDGHLWEVGLAHRQGLGEILLAEQSIVSQAIQADEQHVATQSVQARVGRPGKLLWRH